MTGASLNILAGLVAVLVTFLIGSNADRIGRRLGLLDYPDPFGGRKRHSRVTPLVGGLAIVLGFEIAAIITIALLVEDSPSLDWQVAWIAAAVGAMALVGLADDRFSLSPVLRLAIATIVLTLTVVYAPDFRVEFLRFTGVAELIVLPAAASIIFTLVCLIGLLNAVNMADGKNGLVITLAIIWTAVLFARNPAPFDPLLFAVMGSLIVLLAFNMKGALFLGDGGSYGISAIFGLLAIYAYNHSFATFAAEQVAIMFLIPVLDTVRLMTWRVRHRRSPFAGDRNHLHHYLHARWDWPAGLVIYGALVATPNLLAVLVPEHSLAWLFLGVTMYGATLWATARRGTFREGFSA
jgi:UDP-GlcNAc:undecaprenyl-phosphate/decaprenyl-phosphate GlcNAc-1-phosphate transferase